VTATMPRPGSIVLTRQSPPPKTVPTDVGVSFWAGFTDRGPLKAVPITSLDDFVSNFGSRQSYSPLYDAVEFFFREGGNKLWISRVVGGSAVVASVNLDDSSAGGAYSLKASAKGPGAYANSLRVTVTGTGPTDPYTLTISHTVDGVLEISPALADQQAAVDWGANVSRWVSFTIGASTENPVAVSNAALTAGADDRLSATDADWVTALGRFSRDLGPGQVCQVGRTSLAAYQNTLTHAAANNRRAILDLPDSGNPATIKAAAIAARGATDRYGAIFGPWVQVPGILPGQTRMVPPSAFVCGKIGKNDASGVSPNQPSASSPEGLLITPVGLSQSPYDNGTGVDVTRDDLYSAGINLIVYRYGVFQIFGWRTLTDPSGINRQWVNFGNSRLEMAITAKALSIAEEYILKQIDGQGHLLSQFQGDLIGMLSPYYEQGSLYGTTPEEAFDVNVGLTVNTPTTIANRELHAVISVRMSEDAELVVIEIVKVPIDKALAA
jgi:hypothetical protein